MRAWIQRLRARLGAGRVLLPVGVAPALVLCALLMADDLPLETVHSPVLAAPIHGDVELRRANFEFTGEDRLRLTGWNSMSGARLVVVYRVLQPNGDIQVNEFRLPLTSDRAATTQVFDVGLGFLLNATAYVENASPVIGQTFGKLQIIRGVNNAPRVLGTILQDYVTATQDVAWPGSPLRSSLDSIGWTRVVIGSAPAVGNEISELVPTGARWRVLAIRGRLNTDGTVTDRRPYLHVLSGGNLTAWSPHSVTTAASESRIHNWQRGMDYGAAAYVGERIAPVPFEGLLMGGAQLKTVTTNFQGGDQWEAPVLTVEELLEAA